MEDEGLPPSAAEADRAARAASQEAPAFSGDDSEADQPAPAAEGDEPSEEGPSPDEDAPAEQDASSDEDEGTSPEAEPAEASDDDEDYTEEERAALAQYKGSRRELVRALLHTKSHSLGQRDHIQTLEDRLAEAQQAQQTRRAEREPEGTSPTTAQPERPQGLIAPPLANEPLEVRQARQDLEAMNASFNANEAAIEKAESDLATHNRDLIKLDGRIEAYEEELKTIDPEMDGVRYANLQGLLAGVQSKKDRLENTVSRLQTDRSRRILENTHTHQRYHALARDVNGYVDHARSSERAKANERTTFERQEREESSKIDTALASAIAELKVPKEDIRNLKRALIIAGNGHVGDIPDYHKFFVTEGRWYLRELGRGGRASSAASVGDQLRKDVRQPAPRGPAATAEGKGGRPLTSKEADRIARESSKRIQLS